jgi:hypothetical protein
MNFTATPLTMLVIALAQLIMFVLAIIGIVSSWVWIMLPSTILGGLFLFVYLLVVLKIAKLG